MREHKYRAWDTENKIMCQVYRLEWTDGKLFADCVPHLENIKRVLNTAKNPLMEYTGLKDKDGAEIYEGDIIESVCEIIRLRDNKPTGRFKTEQYEVRWEEDESRWGRWAKGKFELLEGLNKKSMLKWYTVIGNIYETKDAREG